MKVQKIDSVSKKTNQPSFEALKLKTSTIKRAKRTLTKDSVELRKDLPDNKKSKTNKLYGYDPTGRNNDEPKDFTAADAIGLGAMFAIGLAASLL